MFEPHEIVEIWKEYMEHLYNDEEELDILKKVIQEDERDDSMTRL